jgi:hypothetical protein
MCAACNRRHNEDPEPYLRFMVERYGGEAVAELDVLRNDARKVADEELLLALEGLKAARK